ncbi:MAG: RNA polymerase-binding protein DksA [Alphaproteobacteria bacterium]
MDKVLDSSDNALKHHKASEAEIPEGYVPSNDEEFMNPMQLAYFRKKLLDWRGEILRESRETLDHLQEGGIQEPDLADRASTETDWSLELRTRDRQRKLVSKIDSALRRLESGDYGYCEVTGEPISLKRLEARPVATMTLEAQEAHERNERIHRDD